jgi:hypothetical protein
MATVVAGHLPGIGRANRAIAACLPVPGWVCARSDEPRDAGVRAPPSRVFPEEPRVRDLHAQAHCPIVAVALTSAQLASGKMTLTPGNRRGLRQSQKALTNLRAQTRDLTNHAKTPSLNQITADLQTLQRQTA